MILLCAYIAAMLCANAVSCFLYCLVAHLAVCGDIFKLSLALPYDDYVPEIVLLNFLICVSFFTFRPASCLAVFVECSQPLN